MALAGAIAVASFPGCSLFRPSIDRATADRLSAAVLESEDPDTVLAGLPAYVILLDAILVDSPEEPEPWLAAAQLNSVLGSLSATADPERFMILARKALRYAEAGAIRQNPAIGGLAEVTFAELDARLERTTVEDVPAMLALGSAWAAYVRAAGEDVEAIGDLPRVRALLERCLVLDEPNAGLAHLYLGAFDSMVSPEHGGDLGPARRHFERVLELSGGVDLTAKTAIAVHCSGRSGDLLERDKLLREVIAADPRAKGRTLLNVLAQRRARAILAGEKDPWSPF